MASMPTSITSSDIAVRLTCAAIAALALGFNRSEHGKGAGMRITMLACLAAAVTMVEVNLPLSTTGRAADSFVTIDAMRLPLGILTGVGFIGGGAILRRGDIVVGVTTAATLWFATVIGLCFGGGQIGLGLAATLLGLVALWPLGWIEQRLPRERTTTLRIELEAQGPGAQDLLNKIGEAGFTIARSNILFDAARQRYDLDLQLQSIRPPADSAPPYALAKQESIAKIWWQML